VNCFFTDKSLHLYGTVELHFQKNFRTWRVAVAPAGFILISVQQPFANAVKPVLISVSYWQILSAVGLESNQPGSLIAGRRVAGNWRATRGWLMTL
jgi:hypothetical protein